jgi:hypothetical protein
MGLVEASPVYCMTYDDPAVVQLFEQRNNGLGGRGSCRADFNPRRLSGSFALPNGGATDRERVLDPH